MDYTENTILLLLHVCMRRNMFTEAMLREGLHNPVFLLLHACMLLALPSNGRYLQSHCLAMGLYATILM
jgi:hypothetical protein